MKRGRGEETGSPILREGDDEMGSCGYNLQKRRLIETFNQFTIEVKQVEEVSVTF